MLCSKFKQIVLTKSTIKHNVQFRCFITSRFGLKKWVWVDGFFAGVGKNGTGRMSPLRFILRDFRVWSAWTRSNLVSIVVKKCRRDRSVREVIQSFRHTFFRPRRIGLISATAAYQHQAKDDSESEETESCAKNITDEELKALISDLENVESLSKRTLFCANCSKRLVIDKKQNGIHYCSCKVSEAPAESPDGWVPFMEAEDVIIWRKEYKPGAGLYAYKVYGRYPDVKAADFAAVQVDGAYRKVWDSAVAALVVVERGANGLPDQAVLHWEVLWPRLFANRDYVYIRRHKEFDVSFAGQKDVFRKPEARNTNYPETRNSGNPERESVHSKAKRKAMEMEQRERENESEVIENKAYVIISRSCEHPKVPETKHAIRVAEYWSHMVVRTLNGSDKSGMEFVLTYYDEPAVGGMPSSVAAWASGRAAPAYLQRMRTAATAYQQWADTQHKDLPDSVPFSKHVEPEEKQEEKEQESDSGEDGGEKQDEPVKEEDMESSHQGPDLETSDTMPDAPETQESHQPPEKLKTLETKSQSTQTEAVLLKHDVKKDTAVGTETNLGGWRATCQQDPEPDTLVTLPDTSETVPDTSENEKNKAQSTQTEVVFEKQDFKKDIAVGIDTNDKSTSAKEGDGDKEEEEPKNGGSWWRYLHPYYYFV